MVLSSDIRKRSAATGSAAQESIPTDQALVAQACANEGASGQRAFGVLVQRHQAWLVRLLEYLLGNRSDAEDVAQDVFVRAYQALGGFRGDASFRGWLRVIATRQAFNFRRDSGARHRRTAEVEIAPYALNGSGPVMARDAVEKVLERISYPFREIIILRHLEELSVDQIGQMLGIGASATKMRLLRARQHFWNTYEELVHANAKGSA